MGVENYQTWKMSMLRMLQQDGVQYYGPVSHSKLTLGLSQAGFLLYPSRFPETGCITIMRAMVLGVIPISSRFQGSNLRSLTSGFDLGPIEALGIKDAANDTLYMEWIERAWLPSLLTLDSHRVDDLRSRMIAYASHQFSWSLSCEILEDLILNH